MPAPLVHPHHPLPCRSWSAHLFRVHRVEDGPVWFGARRRLHRFDDPVGAFGVLYAGADPVVAYLETVRNAVRPGGPRIAVVDESHLRARATTTLQPRRALRLVDLVDHQAAMHVPGEVMAGSPLHRGYTDAQAWSRALHDHPDGIDGILYRARHDLSRRAVALFDRVGVESLEVVETWRFDGDWGATLDLIESLGHVLVPG